MTVGELKQHLDDFGDHMEVMVVVEQDDTEKRIDLDGWMVDTRTLEGSTVLGITVEI